MRVKEKLKHSIRHELLSNFSISTDKEVAHCFVQKRMDFIVLDFDEVFHNADHALLEANIMQVVIQTDIKYDFRTSFDQLHRSSWHHWQ